MLTYRSGTIHGLAVKRLVLLLVLIVLPASGRRGAGRIHLLIIDDQVINPVIARYVARGIDDAEEEKAECLILQMDTPGGLMESMRQVTNKMVNARVPTVVYIAPRGARAASAGTFIAMAANVIAMAPGTHIGAAHPVALSVPSDHQKSDTIMRGKVENDAVAQIKSLAEQHGRNSAWAVKAVRSSATATEEEALKLGVADLVCEGLPTLLAKLDGRVVTTEAGKTVLRTKGAPVDRREMSFAEKFLSTIIHPQIALLLGILGLYGLIYEFANPGAVIPGVVGAICLILSLFALSALPINYAAAALVLLGIGLMVADLKVASHGILTVGGAIALTLGALMLIDSPDPSLRISWSFVLPLVGLSVGFFGFAVSYGMKAQKAKVTTGREGMVGTLGIARTDLAPEGQVFVHGERWTANATGGGFVPKGAKVKVVAIEGMRLVVEPLAGTTGEGD